MGMSITHLPLTGSLVHLGQLSIVVPVTTPGRNGLYVGPDELNERTLFLLSVWDFMSETDHLTFITKKF